MALDKATPTSHSYFSQRLRLHYLDWGNEEAPPLLLVHGNQDHCRNWDWVAQDMRDDYHIVAPDFRGHGDSEWVRGSSYMISEYVYDLAQLIHQRELAPLNIIAHSLGGVVALRYAGIYPEHINKLVVIEGWGNWPMEAYSKPAHERMRDWIEQTRKIAGRIPKRYPTVEDAYQRMQDANKHLREDQARHLTIHGSDQNEDGTFSWKFDNYTHVLAPFDMTGEQAAALLKRIDAPVLLVSGKESWTGKGGDEYAALFPNARHIGFDQAGHWVQHDQLEKFLSTVREFFNE